MSCPNQTRKDMSLFLNAPICFLPLIITKTQALLLLLIHQFNCKGIVLEKMEVEDFSFPAAGVPPDSPRHRHLPFPHFASSPVWFARHHHKTLSSSSTTSEETTEMEFPSYAENTLFDAVLNETHPLSSQDHETNSGLQDQSPLNYGYELDGKVDRIPDMDSKSSSGSNDGSKEAVDEEDRMDMLWEELNEELHPVLPYGLKGWKLLGSDSDSHGKAEPFSSVRALGMPRSSSSLIHRRRLVMMLKVLKRLFLIQKVRSSKRASSLYQI